MEVEFTDRHTSKRYQELLEQIYGRIGSMGSRVERMLALCEDALGKRDLSRMEEFNRLDEQVDQLEIEIDSLAFKVLASQQPVASDLRFLIALIKAVVDLERIGDLSSNIYHLARKLASDEVFTLPIDLLAMLRRVRKMVTTSLDSLVGRDVETAYQILREDDLVDEAYRSHRKALSVWMREDPSHVDPGIKLFFVAKFLERIADHATNIAEQVIFYVEGEDVRHRGKKRRIQIAEEGAD